MGKGTVIHCKYSPNGSQPDSSKSKNRVTIRSYYTTPEHLLKGMYISIK
jgi:hypothetical protein